MLKNKVNIIPYNELKNYNSIDEVLSPYGQAVILYLTDNSYGHWTALIDQGSHIEFFDSYQSKPDHEFDHINKKERKSFNYKGVPYLSKLLQKSGRAIEYNQQPMQKLGDGVNTCGRHCVVRILLKDIPLSDYQAIMQMFDPDKLVTDLTNKLL